MELNIIVARGRDGAIGRGGDLIWHIGADLKRFKVLTMGHPVIMGRKTWESLPKRPLPGRRNIVLSRTPGYVAEGAQVVASPGDALALAGDGAFVMGGAHVYEAMMPLATRVYLTEIDADCPDADVRMPGFEPEDWETVEQSETFTTPGGLDYRYVTLARREKP